MEEDIEEELPFPFSRVAEEKEPSSRCNLFLSSISSLWNFEINCSFGVVISLQNQGGITLDISVESNLLNRLSNFTWNVNLEVS